MASTELDPLTLDRQLCFALAATSRSVIGLYRDLLDPLGLTHPQYLVMLALWEQDPRSVRAIADELRLDSATLSPLLKRLEAAGYLRRTRSAADERQLEVSLTTAGRALREPEPCPSRWPTDSGGRSLDSRPSRTNSPPCSTSSTRSRSFVRQ
jgi:DNA-binding MarR family transcriptional regulator